jgi:asparagine synthase (glutamine-hydrolysing)
MSAASSEPVCTFSIGFEDPTYNELPYAEAVALRFGTRHRQDLLQPDIAALAVRLVGHLDEPFGDFSIFPTYLVSQLARESVKVVLSGDGGDELFGGYDTYVAQSCDRFYRWLPARIRQQTLPDLLGRLAPGPAKKGVRNKVKRFVEGGALPSALQHTRWMQFICDGDRDSLYVPELCARLADRPTQAFLLGHFERMAEAEPLAQQQYVDIKTYLVDDILCKVDRMSMAASLEARVPLLDHRIVEFALGLPRGLKMRRGQTKVLLRRTMKDHLPESVLNKPKQGFSIPMKHWLRGPLLPMMNDLLSSTRVRRRGYFEPRTVSGWMSEHLQGHANHSHRLWALMVFEMWHQQMLDGGSRFDGR